MSIDEHVKIIIVLLSEMTDSDRRIMIQIETLIRKHLKETGRL